MSDFISAREFISAEFIAEVAQRLRDDCRVHRLLPAGGRLHIDRPLPFLGVHRLRSHDAASGDLLLGQGSFLLTPLDGAHGAQVRALIEAIARVLSEKFGAVLLLEVWTRAQDSAGENAQFRIYSGEEAGQMPVSTARLQKALGALEWTPFSIEASVEPPGNALHWQPFLSAAAAEQSACRMLGLEVPPRFREAPDGPVFPATLRALRRELGIALQKTYQQFMQVQTVETVEDFRALGLRQVGDAVWEADQQLAQIAADWNFLLGVTPVNADAAWQEFRASKFEKTPVFHDRLLPFDPDLLKRQLYNIELERIESPAIQNLFREKRLELDRQITLLEDRQTPRFLPGSMTLYGGIEAPLLELATQILARTERDDEDEDNPPPVAPTERASAEQFAARAQKEVDFYKEQLPSLSSTVQIRDDVPGVMVAAGQLLIAENFSYPAARLEALIQHEVGTHIVSHANGKAQRLRQLYIGFPDYDPLQEGTALLAEFLSGGLHPLRLRLLAARVWAVQSLLSGAEFIETFRALTQDFGYSPRAAWSLTMRVYRSGGFTKDAVYLRGLVWLLDYLRGRAASEIELLWSGKVSGESLGLVRELHLRGVIGPMKLRPRFLGESGAQKRLEWVRGGVSVLDLLEAIST